LTTKVLIIIIGNDKKIINKVIIFPFDKYLSEIMIILLAILLVIIL